jgi:phosphoribosylaminoimidazolecarboxamide formyltransferase/IMP cyclohydrolase
LAVKGFAQTAHYDAAIQAYLRNETSPLQVTAYPVVSLRYGENPHQKAELYSFAPGDGPLGGRVLQGKELSYTNLLDLDGAWKAAVSFTRPAGCIVKHVSPCGIATADRLGDAFVAALKSDPVSAYGGVVAANREVGLEFVTAMGDLFVECIAAPGFTTEARELLAKRKNCRLLEMPDLEIQPQYEIRTITHGLLRQEIDFGDLVDAEDWKVVSDRQPTEKEWEALRFAWEACRHVKSNSIVFAVGETTVGIGGGQPNRVDCVRIATQRAGERSVGAVMASDAFFPFPDSIEAAAQAGITAVVHPGGSIRDAESIEAANRHGMAMVTTGYRHFKH